VTTALPFSGGKNSTAMLLRMLELNEQRIDYIVFFDTKLEYPEMYEYIHKIESYINRKIYFTEPTNDFWTYYYKPYTKGKHKGEIHGFLYTVTKCWFQRESKIRPSEKFYKKYGVDIVYIGYTVNETHRHLKNTKNIEFRYPLKEWGWTDNDCINYLKKYNLMNPLYTLFKRLGCWLCPYQSKKNLYNLYKYYPGYWKILVEHENDTQHKYKIDVDLKYLEESDFKFKRFEI